jgi:hypothetical protein
MAVERYPSAFAGAIIEYIILNQWKWFSGVVLVSFNRYLYLEMPTGTKSYYH